MSKPRFSIDSGTQCFYLRNVETGKYVAKSIGDNEVAHEDISAIAGILNDPLIAAAPELLAALRQVCEAYGCECLDEAPRAHCAMCKGRAVIAKAEGSAQ